MRDAEATSSGTRQLQENRNKTCLLLKNNLESTSRKGCLEAYLSLHKT